MGSHSFKNDELVIDFVNKEPVGFNVTIPPSLIITDKFVITMNGIRSLPGNQGAGKDLEFLQILPATLAKLEILLKLLCVNRGIHQIPSFLNMSAASLQTTRSRPSSVASNVRAVVVDGTVTLKGSP
jgi:hypothetical protein